MAPPDHHLPATLKPGVLTTAAAPHLVPALIAGAGESAAWRYIEFFTANIHNPNTRRAYARACGKFFAWCEDRGLTLTTIRPFDVATYIETLQQTHSAPGVKQHLAAIRMLFDWLVTGQGRRHQPGPCRARPEACRQDRQDHGAHRRTGPRAP